MRAIQFTFVVAPDDGEDYRVTADSRDLYEWENNGEGRSVQDLKSPSMSDLYQLAYYASCRSGLFTGELEKFIKSCALVDFEDEENEVDPTQKGR